jgi:hypothetical protein
MFWYNFTTTGAIQVQTSILKNGINGHKQSLLIEMYEYSLELLEALLQLVVDI